MSAAKAKYRPTRAKFAIGHRHILATAKERAGIVLAFHGAVADVNVSGTDEVKTVVVAVDASVDIKSGKPPCCR
jgi:hypothetical protein